MHLKTYIIKIKQREEERTLAKTMCIQLFISNASAVKFNLLWHLKCMCVLCTRIHGSPINSLPNKVKL